MSTNYDRETGGRNPFARGVDESFVRAVRRSGFTPLRDLREDFTGYTSGSSDRNGNGTPDAQEALNASAEKFVKSAMALKFGQSEVLEAIKLAFSNAIRSSAAAPVKESYDQILRTAIPGAVSVPLNERRPDARKPAKSAGGARTQLVESVAFGG